tara:strand:+ start:261 stop:590 length:330 start_codon:yes stop_codon:yes gene_type:complete
MTIEPSISYDNLKSDDKKRYLAAMSERETLEYYLSPIYSREALKDLNTDELKDLLDELADRYYQINMKNGGSVKPEDYLQLMQILNDLSPEEQANLQFMLNNLKPKNEK